MTTGQDHRSQPREFPLALYFLITSLVVLGGGIVLTTWFMVVEVGDELVRNAVAHAERVVGNVFHQIEEEFLVPLLERGETYDHRDPAQVQALGEVIDRAIFDHKVKKLYFFDTAGLIVYSTQREHIDMLVPKENEHYYEAAAGELSWVLKRRNDPLDLPGDPLGEELLETYVPVTSRLAEDPAEVIGVIEIYQSIEEMRSELGEARWRIVLVGLCSLGMLFVVFSYFIVRADRIIKERRQELVCSNDALRELSRNLESLVERRTQQLIEKEKLASLGSLSAGLAHEINTPLATIAACSEGSLARLAGLPDGGDESLGDVRRYLEIVHSEAFRCTEIIRSLLDYSRQSPVESREALDLDALVNQTLSLVRLNKENRGVEFDLDLHAVSGRVFGDAAQIRQVIHNLIDNAIHAVREVERPRVTLRTRSVDDADHVECEDNGAGVPEDIRERIFEPFFTTKSTREGVGLGLALSYNIAQRHGGRLEVGTATDGRGALFRLVLPRGGAGEEPTA